MTISSVVAYLKKHSNITWDDSNLKLRHIGSGAFRDTYRVGKLPIVIKIPFNEISHARHEARVITKVMKDEKFKALRPFMPKLYYYDKKTGIIVMEYCRTMKYGPTSDAVSKIFSTLVSKLFRKPMYDESDIRGYNIGKNNNGQYKIIDLGLI